MRSKQARSDFQRYVKAFTSHLEAEDAAPLTVQNELHTDASATPICRSQIYHLFFRQFQKQNLHAAFWSRSAHRGHFRLRVIIGTAERCCVDPALCSPWYCR